MLLLNYKDFKEEIIMSYWLDDLIEEMDKKQNKNLILTQIRNETTIQHEIKEKKKNKRKRVDWKEEEVIQIWKGIEKYGNEWNNVYNFVKLRSYAQIKDKGRRLLKTYDWKTGKTKEDYNKAKANAKTLAKQVLNIK